MMDCALGFRDGIGGGVGSLGSRGGVIRMERGRGEGLSGFDGCAELGEYHCDTKNEH